MKAVDAAYQENRTAKRELEILEIFDEILKMEKQGLITHDDVLAAKNVVFNLGDKLRKSITLTSYQDHIREVRRAYDDLQKGKISHNIYRKIIRYRLTDLNSILDYYKKGGFDLDVSYCNLVTAISRLSDYYIHGVLTKPEYDAYVDSCFQAKTDKCILLDAVGWLGAGSRLYKLFMQKIETGCKVINTNIKSRSVKIEMVDSSDHKFTIKKRIIFDFIFISSK